MLTITIDRTLDEPVYEQVAHQIRRLISEGALAPGAALPSVRRLAGDLGVNLNTIARAYRLLAGEGFLEILHRAGARVAAPAQEVEDSTREKLVEDLRAALARLRQAGVTKLGLVEIFEQELRKLDVGGTEDRNE
jgi:GntR family transcriptional regulator